MLVTPAPETVQPLKAVIDALLHEVFDPIIKQAVQFAVAHARREHHRQQRARHRKPFGRRPRV